MLKGKYKIGDLVWTYDHHYEEFIRIKIESAKVVNGEILYNGMYAQQDCFYSLKNAYLRECDYATETYKIMLKMLENRYAKTKELLENDREELQQEEFRINNQDNRGD